MIEYHVLSNFATMAQQVAHVIGNDEVISSNLISSSIVNNNISRHLCLAAYVFVIKNFFDNLGTFHFPLRLMARAEKKARKQKEKTKRKNIF